MGRTAWSSLFVFGAALLLLAASLLAGNAYRWTAIALLVVALLACSERSPRPNALGVTTALFCLWLFVDAAAITPVYTADGLYRPVILLAGFASASGLGRAGQLELFRAGLAILVLLVLIGLLQFFFGFWHLEHNPQRAAATFITPNTFATAINLFLLPLIALVVTGNAPREAFWIVLWLFAGLLSTESRGGWVAFLAGLGFFTFYTGFGRRRELWRPALRLVAGLAAVAFVFYGAARIGPPPPGLGQAFGEGIVGRGTSYRIDIAMITLANIAERPFLGVGSGTFRAVYEMTKPASLDIGQSFPFAHNDYLQIWLEFGLPGLALLLTMVAAAGIVLAKARRSDPANPLPLACGAALTGVFVHASVDFPFYVPFLLLVIGLWLGALAVYAGRSGRLAGVVGRAGAVLGRFRSPVTAGALAVAGLAWLAQPVLADYAGSRSVAELLAGRPATGLYWNTVARRLEPHNGAHYWAEGVILGDQAIEAHDRALAARADGVLAQGSEADPYQVANYLERARLRRIAPELFDDDPQRRLALAQTQRAMKLRPYSLQVRAEHARTLQFVGRTDEARQVARAMLQAHPGSELAQRLAREL